MSKFWGLVLLGEKRYVQKVESGFCISNAVLETKQELAKEANDKPVKLYAERDNAEFLLGIFSPRLSQLPLRIKFGKGETVALRIEGGLSTSRLHLSGYSFADNAVSPFKGQGQSILVTEPKTADTKKRVSIKDSSFSSLDTSQSILIDSDDEDSSDDDVLPVLNGQPEEESSDDDDDDDDSDEQPDLVNKVGQQKKEDAGGQAASDDDDEDSEDDDDDDDDDDDVEMVSATAAAAVATSKGDKKKVKGGEGVQQMTPSPKDKARKSEPVMKTPENQNLKLKTPSSAGHTPMKFFSKQGVMCQDLRPGNGPPAKHGKNVTVYYSGRLKSNNKQFDANEKGPGFKFRLGKSEVIKGWDLGVEGMKVGGKRRLIIPANLAYGKKGAPPDIPPNSTLIFDVELKNVN